ncbi:MAG: class I SAM-dependent methyltransferase [Winogradskyella sp.]|nr:class I SAM-dependent methyltransferase [Winogradskyella sp.]
MGTQKRTQEDISKEFNVFSANYTEDMIKCVPYYITLLNAFSQDYPSGFSPQRILDLGCGNGNVTDQLVSVFPTAEYTLLDASEDMLKLCEERFKGFNISFVKSYFKDFSFSENNFDLIVAGFSLHHCEAVEKQLLFKNIYKSLVSGGVLAMSDLMINKNHQLHELVKTNWKQLVLSNYPDDEKWQWIMEHYAEFDRPDDLNDQIVWLETAGFKVHQTLKKEDYWVHLKVKKSKL